MSAPVPSTLDDARRTASGGLPPAVIWVFARESGADGGTLREAVGEAPDLAAMVRGDGGFRWLHLQLADHATLDWIQRAAGLPGELRDMLLSTDAHQRAVVDGPAVGLVLHDLKRDLQMAHTDEIGPLALALLPGGIITARRYPLGCGDIFRRKLAGGARVAGPADALALVVTAITENLEKRLGQISAQAQAVEDALLAEHASPGNRQLLRLRRLHALLHRVVDGAHKVFLRLERDHDLPEGLEDVTERLAQRLLGLDSDLRALQGQLLLLRDEMEAQSNQRINQNLYLLSVLTALMMPATLVTGFFGMNTGDLPFVGHGGSLWSTGAVAGSSLLAYLFLRARGFFR